MSIGKNPRQYLGVRSLTPPNLTVHSFAPNQYDYDNFDVGDWWLVLNTSLWYLQSKSAGVSTWVQVSTGGDPVLSIGTQDGHTVTPLAGLIFLNGGPNLTTTGTIGPNTVTLSLINGTNGQLLIGGGSNPAWANLTSAGMTVTITNTPNGINLETAGGGATTVTAVGDTGFAVTLAGSFNIVGGTNIATSGDNAQTLTINNTGNASLTWTDVTGTSQAMAINKGYTANNAGLVTLTLPSTAAYGSIFYVVGKGAGGWKIAQNSGQTIHFGSVNTTTGTSGYLASTLQYDVVAFICSIADTDFTVIQSVGDITYV